MASARFVGAFAKPATNTSVAALDVDDELVDGTVRIDAVLGALAPPCPRVLSASFSALEVVPFAPCRAALKAAWKPAELVLVDVPATVEALGVVADV
jgi:hypothetical protein